MMNQFENQFEDLKINQFKNGAMRDSKVRTLINLMIRR